MQVLYESNTPVNLYEGEWHLPFILSDELEQPLYERLAVSTARAARTSYRLPGTDNYSDFDADLILFKKLLSKPLHASPFEFVATPLPMHSIYGVTFPDGITSELYGNTYGWVQLRSFFAKQKIFPEGVFNKYDEVYSLIKKVWNN